MRDGALGSNMLTRVQWDFPHRRKEPDLVAEGRSQDSRRPVAIGYERGCVQWYR
jgi:hypothetical protein